MIGRQVLSLGLLHLFIIFTQNRIQCCPNALCYLKNNEENYCCSDTEAASQEWTLCSCGWCLSFFFPFCLPPPFAFLYYHGKSSHCVRIMHHYLEVTMADHRRKRETFPTKGSSSAARATLSRLRCHGNLLSSAKVRAEGCTLFQSYRSFIWVIFTLFMLVSFVHPLITTDLCSDPTLQH